MVEINYRLGAFGWLAGPTLQAAGGVSNAGLHDQRLAIEWVQKYIHLFGGDPNRITLIGESAGGGSIMHQITAYGGQRPVPFQRAIPQSPGFYPIPSEAQQEETTQAFLALLNVSTIGQVRELPSEVVIAANSLQVGDAQYGQYTYGPVVDGSFVPSLPGLLLQEGAFAKEIFVMVGHNTNEGVLFTDPRVVDDAALLAHVQLLFPSARSSVVSFIVNDLYPAVYDGSYGYTSALTRMMLIISESIFTCNTFYVSSALGNHSYAYEFSVPPAIHFWDVAYTFYNGVSNVSGELVYPHVAQTLQQYITDFAQYGSPDPMSVAHFPSYGMTRQELNINATGSTPVTDPTANESCLWWQNAFYLQQ